MTSSEMNDRSRKVSALAQEIREQLGEHNVLDALARELALSRLQVEDLATRLEATEGELSAIKLAQRARDILLPKAATEYAGRKEAQVDATAPLSAERGFHALERDGNGNAFRWTGPTPHFHYDLHLDRSGLLMFSLQVPLWGAEHAKNLTSSSDGVMIPLRRRTVGRMLVLDGVLLPRAEIGLTRIDFQVERTNTVTPKTEGALPRELGLPVVRLKVVAIDDDGFKDWSQAVDLADAPRDDGREVVAAPARPPAAKPKATL